MQAFCASAAHFRSMAKTDSIFDCRDSTTALCVRFALWRSSHRLRSHLCFSKPELFNRCAVWVQRLPVQGCCSVQCRSVNRLNCCCSLMKYSIGCIWGLKHNSSNNFLDPVNDSHKPSSLGRNKHSRQPQKHTFTYSSSSYASATNASTSPAPALGTEPDRQ